MKYNDNINSIDLKLYANLIYHVIERFIIERFIIEFSLNYYFENKSLFESKSSIFDRINQINQIEFDQKYEYLIKKTSFDARYYYQKIKM